MKDPIISQRTPVSKCVCGYTLDGANGPGLVRPGDLSVCFNCANVAVFDENRSVRPLTEAEKVEIENDPETRKPLERARAQILADIAKNGRSPIQ